MAVDKGKFALYSKIAPALTAGEYRLTADQALHATDRHGNALDPTGLPVQPLSTHFRVRAPRFVLPPDQVLSTYPPANSEGSFGMRLPQIVIKRRTLPWEREVETGNELPPMPWLALVLIAEGEAELRLNQNVADCITPGTVLADTVMDVEKGNCLVIRKSMIDAIFPTQRDVPLLSHAREVDIHDTELMMGDDDGFLAVVIANRLPLPGRDAQGKEIPVKYLACLVNLEGQGAALLKQAPVPLKFTLVAEVNAITAMTVASHDQMNMAMVPAAVATGVSAVPHGPAPLTNRSYVSKPAGPIAFEAASTWSASDQSRTTSDVYADMARPFAKADLTGHLTLLDPVYSFPVLLHWSFTSVGSTTFRELMEQLDVGLLGTVPDENAADRPATDGRPPLEVVETGHVGLTHRTRVGDQVRAWYRGPFVPHPTSDLPDDRLPLAHASDQLRIVVPDGREDLSLASAFEIGRLLALARPAMVAALLRWRQVDYQIARRKTIWQDVGQMLELLAIDPEMVAADLGRRLGRGLTRAIAEAPEKFIGDPAPLVRAGRPLPVAGTPEEHLAGGLAIDRALLAGGPARALARLREASVPVAQPAVLTGAGEGREVKVARQSLIGTVDRELIQLFEGTMPGVVREGPPPRPGKSRGRPPGKTAAKAPPARPRDALDRLLDALDEDEP